MRMPLVGIKGNTLRSKSFLTKRGEGTKPLNAHTPRTATVDTSVMHCHHHRHHHHHLQKSEILTLICLLQHNNCTSTPWLKTATGFNGGGNECFANLLSARHSLSPPLTLVAVSQRGNIQIRIDWERKDDIEGKINSNMFIVQQRHG